jgi:hypothetical protein
VATAGSALAVDAGAKTYTWPAHCNTSIVLYVHGWNAPGKVADGRMDVHTCTGSQGITAVVFDDIIFYRNRRDSNGVDHIAEIGRSGYKNVSITNANYVPVYTTSDASCGFSAPIEPGDDIWVNADYQIFWQDGTHTTKRDDNSYAVNAFFSNIC